MFTFATCDPIWHKLLVITWLARTDGGNIKRNQNTGPLGKKLYPECENNILLIKILKNKKIEKEEEDEEEEGKIIKERGKYAQK